MEGLFVHTLRILLFAALNLAKLANCPIFALKILPANIKFIAHFRISKTSNCKIAKINTRQIHYFQNPLKFVQVNNISRMVPYIHNRFELHMSASSFLKKCCFVLAVFLV